MEMSEVEQEPRVIPATEIAQIARYAAEAALIGSGVEVTHSWVDEVTRAYINNPSGQYPEGIENTSPLSQTEIDAYLSRVPTHAKTLGMHLQDETKTIVFAPYEWQWDSSAYRFDYGVGVYDDANSLYIEFI